LFAARPTIINASLDFENTQSIQFRKSVFKEQECNYTVVVSGVGGAQQTDRKMIDAQN
jgi:hypothetical protein